MRSTSKNRRIWSLFGVAVAAAAALFALWRMRGTGEGPASPDIALHGAPPDWHVLDAFQHLVSREAFTAALIGHFTVGDRWRDAIHLTPDAAEIATGLPAPHAVYRLQFAPTPPAGAPPRWWRTAREMPPAPTARPLAGVHIALDPGHLGGPWARIEERSLEVAGQPPVREGDLTLQLARQLKTRLEALGAKVSLIRDSHDPLTPWRPESLLPYARTQCPPGSTETPEQLAQRLFYRTAEIRARATRVNNDLKPDLVLCLHFNADAWGDPANPLLVDHSHLHLLVNGAYSDDELSEPGQRFQMLLKLLQGTHTAEIDLATDVAAEMATTTGLPPFQYTADAKNARAIPQQPYLWARNLLANRLYQCPVVFLEPYVMNSRTDHARLVAGDYDGLREIAGAPRPSILREYTDGLIAGLTRHYHRQRPTLPPPGN